MKGKRILALILAFVLAFPAVWGNASMTMQTQAEEAQERRLENLRRQEDNYTWLFEKEEEYTISLNTEGMENIEEVQWDITLYPDGEEKSIRDIQDLPVALDEVYTVNDEDCSITLYGVGLCQVKDYMKDGNQWFQLGVEVKYAGNKTFAQWIEVGLMMEEYYEDYMSGQAERDMLPNEDKYLRRWMPVSLWDAEHPDGAYEEYLITEMQLLEQYHWDESGEPVPAEEDFFRLEGDSENGWMLHSDDHGFVEVKATYVNGNNEEIDFLFEIYSVGEIYYLELFTEKSTNNILTNAEERIETKLTKKYQDHEGQNYYGLEIEDYILEVNHGYNEAIMKTSVDDKTIFVQAGNIEANAGFEVNIFTMEDGERQHRVGIWHDIHICHEFYNIEPVALENPGVGEVLDLSGLYVAKYNAENPDGKQMDAKDVRLSVEYYETSVLEPTEDLEKNPLPNFTRFRQEGANVGILAERRTEDGWEELVRRDFWIDGLDYHVWFENLQYGDHGYVWSGEDHVVTINRDNLNDKKDYTLIFEVGQNVNDEFVPYKNQNGLYEEVKENGVVTGYKLKGKALAAMKDDLRDGGWFDIRVSVFLGQEEVSQDWRGMELREEWIDYHHREWGIGLLPHWDHGVDKNFDFELSNKEHPDGFGDRMQYSDIRVEVVDGKKNMLEVSEWEDGNGWNLHANDFGYAVVTLTYPSATNPDEELEHSFDVWVGEDVWNLELVMSMGTGDIRPGESMDVRADITHERFTHEEGHHKGDTSQVAYRWGYCDGCPEDLVDFEEEGNVLHITARENAEDGWNTRIWVRAYMTDEDGNILTDENGNEMEVAYNDFEIGIRGSYLTILPVELEQTVELGESFALEPQLVGVNEDGAIPLENVKFKYEWDMSELQLVGADGEELSRQEDGRSDFTEERIDITKLVPWDARVAVYAYLENENGDYEEVFCRWIRTGDISYNVWFEKDRGGEGFTFLYANENEYKLPLNTDALRKEDGSLKDNISIEWTVGERNPEGNFVKEFILGEEYTLNEELTEITLNAEKILANGFKERLMMEVVVKSNGVPVSEEPYRVNFWIQDEVFELEDEVTDTLLCEVGGWIYENDTMTNFVRNSMYPDGERLEFEIRNIESVPVDGGEGDVFEITHDSDTGNWRIATERLGEAQITYTLYHESFGEIQVNRNKRVVSELYEVGLLSSTHCWEMLTNDELQMEINVVQFVSTENNEYEAQIIPRDRYELRFEYNPDLITIDENGKISSHDWYDMTGVYVEAQVQMLDGESIYTVGNSVEVYVTPEYEKICAETLYMEPEDVVNFDDVDIYRLYVTEDNREGERREVDGFDIYLNEMYLEASEDGTTMKFVYDYAEEELPLTFGMDYEAFYEGQSRWDYMDVVVCRHSMTEWFVDKEPTNIEDGLEIRWCDNCGMVEERVMESLKLAVTDVFSDVYKDWYTSYVQYVFDHQLMTGIKGTTQFQPNANITKAQVAQVLYNMEGQPKVEDVSVFSTLKDVYDAEWYANAVAWAFNNNIVTGDLNTKKFNPNADVTREQLALMIFRYAGYKGYDVSESSDLAGLKNAENVSNWAADGVKWAVGEGLISGIEKNGIKDLAPQGNASRAQVAAILMRFCQAYEE